MHRTSKDMFSTRKLRLLKINVINKEGKLNLGTISQNSS